MSTQGTTLSFPSIDPMKMLDWLPKLGEKAFLAWLQLHSWKQNVSSPSPVLPLSINRIIKRLKVGNSTFYDQILRPLWNYGLIDLQKTHPRKKGQQLILYAYPNNDPEKASSPLLQLRDYDFDPPKAKAPIATEESTQPEPPIDSAKEENPPTTPLSQQPAIQEDSPSEPTLSDSEYLEAMEQEAASSLPLPLQEAIEKDPELQKRAQDIKQVYHQCKYHSQYNHKLFLQKARTCLRYAHDPRRFAAYLHKSLRNEWNRSTPYPTPSTPKPSGKERPHDVPEWVWKQQYEPQEEQEEITPEQKAIIDDLLRQLGEIP
ncbi:hypothetical protein [Ammoniphilus resinae]|uniref:Uncharacterized protein n=1 Tax=Ammoniphilus resinae TaxID=861532 RepID=A0ABS4GX40_9BACL|nr:hypothetical protein [Ammoniphilus resinae]MBP1934833.1 hypothetical protein [Ammoniphilus resinae]